MRWCVACWTHHWDDETCYPSWYGWCPDAGDTVDDALTVNARDSHEAAVRWAQKSDEDSGEYDIVHGDAVVVHVRPVAGGSDEVERYQVSGEMVPDYMASPMRRPEEGGK